MTLQLGTDGTGPNRTAADRDDRASGEPLVGSPVLHRRFNPSHELFWAKIAYDEQTLEVLHGPRPEILRQCRRNLACAKACVERRRAHSHLAWRFLHRVDEDLLLVLPDEQLAARAIDVKSTFELNVDEPCVRAEWLGDGRGKGRLPEAIDALGSARGEDVSHSPERYVLREALHTVNDRVDRGFWTLSLNVVTALWSGLLLAGLAGLVAVLWHLGLVPALANALPPEARVGDVLGEVAARDLLPVAIFGAMGTYLSNLLRTKDFLFVQGGPYLRYLLHPLLTMPILGAFAAAVVYAIAQTGMLFSIGPMKGAAVAFEAQAGALGYVYALLALVSGFAADKVLGATIGAVLRRLEQSAEKTAGTREDTTSA